MKITFIKGLLWFGFGGLVIGAGFIALRYFSKKTEEENRNALNQWVNQNLSETLAKKLNMSVSSISEILQGVSDIHIMKRIQDELNSVKLIFMRLSSKADIQLRLDVSYKDGTSFSATMRKEWEQLTENIRGQFLRTGKQTLHEDWNFSWSKR